MIEPQNSIIATHPHKEVAIILSQLSQRDLSSHKTVNNHQHFFMAAVEEKYYRGVLLYEGVRTLTENFAVGLECHCGEVEGDATWLR